MDRERNDRMSKISMFNCKGDNFKDTHSQTLFVRTSCINLRNCCVLLVPRKHRVVCKTKLTIADAQSLLIVRFTENCYARIYDSHYIRKLWSDVSQITPMTSLIIIMIISSFQEDNIFGTNASLTYGPRLQR